MPSLSDLSSADPVTDIVVFVADSLRFDALPDSVRSRGVTARTIAASTYTASSVPSMFDGVYPSKHKVWSFDDALERSPPLFNGADRGLETRNVWQNVAPAQRPPLRSLRLKEETRLKEVSSPSLIAIHDRGAHGPYDFRNNDYETSGEFFVDYRDCPGRLRKMYHAGVADTAERFLGLADEFADEETLLVFTSDHGELLGEPDRGGVFGHGSPVTPELVTVPTVFVGAGLPEGRRFDSLLSGTDLAPTLMGAQGRDVPSYVDGTDVWNEAPPPDRVCRSEYWAAEGRLRYGAGSAWDEKGGVVSHVGTRRGRIAFAFHRKLWKGAQAPANRTTSLRTLRSLLGCFGQAEVVYGDPDPAVHSEIVDEFSSGEDAEYQVAPPSSEQLKALGYLE